MFRIIGKDFMPVGDIILEPDLKQILSYSIGESVIDLQTYKTVYTFNRDLWQWEKV